MTDPKIPVTEDELHAYVDNELPAERRGDVEAWLAAHPDDAERVQSWRAMADALHARYDGVVNEPVPRRLELERLCGSRAAGSTARSRRLAAFVAGGGAGWVARGAAAVALAVPELHRGCAGRAPALCRRRAPSGRGARRRGAHLQQWLTSRCGWAVRAPELGATGLKLVGGRLLPGPSGPASFLMYERPVRRALHGLRGQGHAEATRCATPAGRRRRTVLGRPRRRLCRQRQQRPRTSIAGCTTGLRSGREERRSRQRCKVESCPIPDIENLESRTPVRLNIAPDDHEKMSSVRSADRRKRPRSGFGTALVPLSRPHFFRIDPRISPARLGPDKAERKSSRDRCADYRVPVAPLLHQGFQFGVVAVRQHDAGGDEQVAGRRRLRQALALEPEGAAARGVFRDRKFDRAAERRHPDLGAEHGLIERDRQIELDVAALDLEVGMRRDAGS